MADTECPYCGKLVAGLNQDHAEKQLFMHKVTKHLDKLKITEISTGRKIAGGGK